MARARSRFVAATMRSTSTRDGLAAAHALDTSRSCRTRSSLACSSSGMSPISSRKSVPPWRARSARRRAGDGSGEGARARGRRARSRAARAGSPRQFTGMKGLRARGLRPRGSRGRSAPCPCRSPGTVPPGPRPRRRSARTSRLQCARERNPFSTSAREPPRCRRASPGSRGRRASSPRRRSRSVFWAVMITTASVAAEGLHPVEQLEAREARACGCRRRRSRELAGSATASRAASPDARRRPPRGPRSSRVSRRTKRIDGLVVRDQDACIVHS